MGGARQTMVALATALALASSSLVNVQAQAPAAATQELPPDIRPLTPAEKVRLEAIHLAWSDAFVRGQTVPPALLREALEIETATKGANHPDTGRTISILASAINHNLGNPAEAAPLYARAVSILVARLGIAAPDTYHVMSSWALALESLGQLPEAEAVYRRMLASAEAI